MSIYLSHQEASEVTSTPINADSEEYGCIARPQADIIIHTIDKGLFTFLTCLKEHATLEKALEAALDVHVEFNPSDAISFLIQSGVCSELITPDSG